MTSRLDRLFLLLDSGSTAVTRKAAAESIGEVQKLHPHDLPNLLQKVSVFLRSDTWETRIAAGQAIEAIARNVPLLATDNEPAASVTNADDKRERGAESRAYVEGRLSFSSFDVSQVLCNGVPLLGSSGQEYNYDVDVEMAGLAPNERASRQRKLLLRRLGLDSATSGMETGSLIEDEDLLPYQLKASTPVDCVKAEAGWLPDLSAREKNRAKRMAKRAARLRPKDFQGSIGSASSAEGLFENKSTELEGSFGKKPKLDDETGETFVADVNQLTTENEWPFEWFCEELCKDLFNTKWTIRHGAATGLREILKMHAKGGGTTRDMTSVEANSFNGMWLGDVSLRLVCLLALDRFGDYVSDEVVAPVRETCAQALGVLLKHVEPSQVNALLDVLLKLLSQSQWQVRHGGLLGIKYLLAVRQDMTTEVVPLVLPAIMSGLVDSDDDVRAVSSAALLPVANQLSSIVPQEIPLLLSSLWDVLVDLDELSASTNSVMTLLSSLLSTSSAKSPIDGLQIDSLVPRLWRFLKHTISSVRKSAAKTFLTLVLLAPMSSPWINTLCSDLMQHLFLRLAFESKMEVRETILKVWHNLVPTVEQTHLASTATSCIRIWLTIAVFPTGAFADARSFSETGLIPHSTHHALQADELMLGGATGVSDGDTVQRAAITARLDMAKALGFLMANLFGSAAFNQIVQFLLNLVKSTSVTQQLIAALIIAELATVCLQSARTLPNELFDGLVVALERSCSYDEHASLSSRLQADGQNLLTAFLDKGVNLLLQFQSNFTLESATVLATSVYSTSVSQVSSSNLKSLELARSRLLSTIDQFQALHRHDTVRVYASLALALVSLKVLPKKLNPVIRPLMESIKMETNSEIQLYTCKGLAELLDQCSQRLPCPNSKILKNLCSLLCSCPELTPNVSNPIPSLFKAETGDIASTPVTPDLLEDDKEGPDFSKSSTPAAGGPFTCTQHDGIISLVKHQQQALLLTSRKYASLVKKERLGAPFLPTGENGENNQRLWVQYKGGKLALAQIASHVGSNVPTTLPKLWESFMVDLQKPMESKSDSAETEAQSLVNAAQVLEVVSPALHCSLLPQLTELLPRLCSCLSHPYTAVRHMAARSFSALASVIPRETLEVVVTRVVALMSDADCVQSRQGATETVAVLIDSLGVEILPYAIFLVVPLLGRMSDQDKPTRAVASQTFAKLIQIIPLEAGLPDPAGMSESLVEQRKHEREFLEMLLNPKQLCEYKISVPIKAELRQYQQNGVNWLAFLNRYKLHGVLCDDMGLGKTLQSICILASDHHQRNEEYKAKGNAEMEPIPSLVVCPPTLTGHWCYEVEKFCSTEYLNPLHYTGGPQERQRLWQQLHGHNLVIASYDIVRNDVDSFRSLNWNYLILDEGHVIKNGKTKLSKAIKSLKANHRLILTGTPIQNNVLELWSLFDFLMPGFLGTEREFTANYNKPILQSRDAKSSSREQEAGILAMENLHRQVLPFMLRRLKEDVLQDLPPKIIQDYYCDLSPLQSWLYEDFAKSKAKKVARNALEKDDDDALERENSGVQESAHVFQALQYLRKVCNHPLLVLTPQHPLRDEVMAKLSQQKSSLHSITHAAKLVALKQLLLDCGIGVMSAGDSSGGGGGGGGSGSVVGQHRALIFCQLKSMLDILENDLLKNEMPSVTYLRLDGSTPAGSRHNVVQKFNLDPSFDVLLLTTHVGGLGLNLTGADTVIFIEHDWNPMKDLQAMDRAHRIGQKKVVNVYRLITKGTLEEKVMGLQKFKLNIANTVVTNENSGLQTMETGELLDLFNVTKKGEGGAEIKRLETSQKTSKSKETVKSVLEKMGDLWDEKQYENEYDLTLFMKSL